MNLINLQRTGEKCAGSKKSKIYDEVQRELLPPPIKLGGKNTWVEQELDAVLRARISGKSDDEIRALVRQLVAARAAAAEGSSENTSAANESRRATSAS